MSVPDDSRPSPTGASAAPDSDEALVVRLGGGDEGALRVLHQRYAPLVFTVAARFVDTATAEDVVQDVFVTLWNKHQTYDPTRGSFKKWIVQVARHRALNEVRRNKSRGRLTDEPLDGLADDAFEPDELQWRAHRRAAIQRAVDALPSAQRQALSLAFFDELTHEQIASALQTPVGTTKTRIRLALRRLAPVLLPVLSIAVIGVAVAWWYQEHQKHLEHQEHAARNERALRMVTASDVVQLRLKAAPGTPTEAHGTYRTRPGATVAVLTTSHLPPLTASQTYAAWAHSQGSWRYLGAFVVESDGRSLLVCDPPRVAPDELRVTVETIRQKDAPRGAVVLEWSSSDAVTPPSP